MISKYYLVLTVILSISFCGSYTVTAQSKAQPIPGKLTAIVENIGRQCTYLS
jgi:hypothetical protein